MVFTCLPQVSSVYAASYPYDTLKERTVENQRMYKLAADEHRSSTVMKRYQEKH